METIELVKKCQQGDTAAFSQIYEEFAQRLYKFILLKINNKEQAEDLLQEVFIKAWRGLPKLSLVNLNLSAWLYKVTSNTINDHLRKLYRSPRTTELNENLDFTDHHNLEKEMNLQSDLATIKQALKDLPKPYQQILELRFIQDFNINETAEILGKTNLAIRVLQHRALKQLKELIKHDHVLEY